MAWTTAATLVPLGVLLAGGSALAKAESHDWYGSWSESVAAGGGSGAVSYMAHMNLVLKGSRAVLETRKDGKPVAALRGRVVSSRTSAKGEILQLEFPSQPLTHTFALSTAALVDGVLVNKYKFPGLQISLDRAYGSYRARVRIGGDGRVVDATWSGKVDRWRPTWAAPGWQPEARAKARALARDLTRRGPQTMRIKGSFSNRNLVTGVLPGRAR